ncbi:MAG: hypothetical protein ACFFDS_09535 [Candidatus Thorarchaeota archaeon]
MARIQEQDYREYIYFKQLGFSIARDLTRTPEGFISDLDLYEIQEELKSGHYVPSLKQLNQAFEFLWKSSFREVAVHMLRTLERSSDLLSVPSGNGDHLPYTEPRIREEYPVLIRRHDIEMRGNKHIIKIREKIELPNFPRKSGRIKYDIEELGIEKGTYIFVDGINEKLGSMKNLLCGSMSINPENRYVLANFSPWYKNERLGFRLCSNKPTDNVVIRVPTLDDYS